MECRLNKYGVGQAEISVQFPLRRSEIGANTRGKSPEAGEALDLGNKTIYIKKSEPGANAICMK